MPSRLTRPVLVLALLATLAGLLGVLVFKRPAALFLLDNLHWTASYLSASILVYQRWAQTQDRTMRKGLGWCLAGVLSMLLGQLLQDGIAWSRWHAMSLLADAFFLACGPCLTIGLVYMTLNRLKPDDWRAVALDSAGFLVATLAATLALFIPRQGEGDLLLVSMLAAYPLSLMAPTSLGLILLLKLRVRAQWQSLLLPVSTGTLMVLWSIWNLDSLTLSNTDGSLVNMGLSVAALGMGVGLRALRLDTHDSPQWDRQCEGVLRMLPLVLVLLAALGVTLTASLNNLPESTRSIVQLGAAIVVMLAFIRQGVLLRERDRLIIVERMLRQREAELEARVAERTRDLEISRQQAETARAAAETASQVKSEFLANMSHEIRTPLNGVIGFSQLALMTTDNPDQRRYMTNIQLASNQLLRLINDILDMSKIEAGKLQLERIRFDLGSVIQSVATQISPRLTAKNLAWSMDAPPATAIPIWGDPLRVEQILLNYANNAIKFTEQGRVGIEVRLLSETPTHVTIKVSVTDTGIGMDEPTRQRLFAAFEQADSSTTRRFGGTGLGLAICKQLAAMMGGEVGVESQLGQGSRFWFTLHAEKAADTSPPQQSPSSGEVRTQTTQLNGKRILLAEDNELNEILARSILEQHGYVVRVARTGQQALDLWHTEPFDCILMDMHMPVMDGLTATRHMRQDTQRPRTPIIAMTASARAEDMQECRAAGMDDFISKPFQVAQLVSTLAHWTRPPEQAGA
ncbi:hybrid sensor histidine kinase/response regulator [Aquabacterium sp.]|uniref:hybrid sensor histidine kinase/response regulator n=1 Tax=Aquabacterium sp. TaxID=1872578 RepID=UPI002E310873|nr:response regulator [Aquabacterium sp.]HEX5310760.1 response regulator [Aquabacterium sp.]